MTDDVLTTRLIFHLLDLFVEVQLHLAGDTVMVNILYEAATSTSA
jgi:hypothetical protein